MTQYTNTISTFEPLEKFPTEESDRLYFEKKLWNEKLKCPLCANQTPTQIYRHPSRAGKTIAVKMDQVNSINIQAMIDKYVDSNATLCTDEATVYKGIEDYKQLMVKHSAGQYVDEIAHTNGIKSVWALLKRSYIGVFHYFSDKHIGRYVDEFVFRLNKGNVKPSTLERIESMMFGFSGNRLSYKMLVLIQVSPYIFFKNQNLS